MTELGGSVVVITGASRGIGEALAHAFAGQGCHIVLSARSQDAIEALAAEIQTRHGVETLAVPTDVTRPDQLEGLMQAAADRMGGIDILINNAGLGSFNPVESVTDQELQYLFEVNVFGAVRAMRAAVPHLRARGGGSIVNIGSIVSYMALPQYQSLSAASATYCATKFALRAFSFSAHAELHADSINVTLAVVGLTKTDFFARGFHEDPQPVRERSRPAPVVQLRRQLAVPPAKVAARVVKAVRRGEREIFISWWDFLLVQLAARAPALFALLTRSLFPVLGRPVATASPRAFWAGMRPQDLIPLVVVVGAARWLLKRLRPARKRSE